MLAPESILLSVFWPEPVLRGDSPKNQANSPRCTGHGILPMPTHTQDMCTASHRISKNSCLRALITSHMEMCKILVRRAVISHRLALEFIFIRQNANVNVQKEPLSLGAKEADPLMFFFPALFSFYFLSWGSEYF